MRLDFSNPGKKWKLYASLLSDQKELGLPFPREWTHENFKLPPNWREIFLKNMESVLKKYRSVRLFMDLCVHCGACADKCPFFLATRDPHNMPVARQDLFRSVYKKFFDASGKLLGTTAGAVKDLDEKVVDDWYTYFYQCSECRRCGVFCPYGIDTAEITIAAREVLLSIGLSTKSTTQSINKCEFIGNHLGIPPAAMANSLEFMEEELREEGWDVEIPLNKKGAEILFVTPSADYFGDPHWYTMKGYVKLFHVLDLDYTLSTYASEGGNFGLFLSYEHMKKINAKIYKEAKRLGVKWILGGECGHMYRVVHNFMGSIHEEPPDFLEEPVSPITGTKFKNAVSTKMVHICEFTADLIKHGKLKLDPSKNDQYVVTYHDSCNPARAMGLIEEPRYILRHVCNHYVELDPSVNRERTICCTAGGGLLTDECLELRYQAIKPKIDAIKRSGANFLALICAIDKAAFPTYMRHYKLPIRVGGVHELVGNALVPP